VLHVALQRAHDLVLAVLIGLMAGSVRVLWPWPDGVDSTELAAPDGDWLMAIGLALVAFVVVMVVARYAQGLEAADEHPDVEPHEPAEPAESAASDEPAEAAT
jgi:putative membrane protein